MTIRVKVKCEQTILHVVIAMYYWRHTSSEVKGQWELLLPHSLLITMVQHSRTLLSSKNCGYLIVFVNTMIHNLHVVTILRLMKAIFFKETAHSQDWLVLRVTNTHQTTSQWLLFANDCGSSKLNLLYYLLFLIFVQLEFVWKELKHNICINGVRNNQWS